MRQQTLSSTISVTLAFGAAEFENPYVLLDATACQDTMVFYMLLHGSCLSLRKTSHYSKRFSQVYWMPSFIRQYYILLSKDKRNRQLQFATNHVRQQCNFSPMHQHLSALKPVVGTTGVPESGASER